MTHLNKAWTSPMSAARFKPEVHPRSKLTNCPEQQQHLKQLLGPWPLVEDKKSMWGKMVEVHSSNIESNYRKQYFNQRRNPSSYLLFKLILPLSINLIAVN